MSAPFQIRDLRGQPRRDALLRVSNASAKETSLLSPDQLDRLINLANLALFVPPAAAFLLAFSHSDNYDGGHFLWFRSRFEKFLYIDRVVVAEEYRRHGLGRTLYDEAFKHAAHLGQVPVVCEVNLQPPNPISDGFHAALGFEEVGRATINNGAKTVRYLAAGLRTP